MFKKVQHIAKHQHAGYIYTEITEQAFLLGFKWGKLKTLKSTKDRITYDKIIPTDKFGHPFVLKVGSKIINVGDQGESYRVREVIDFEDYKGKFSGTKRAPAVPVVKDSNGNVYITFGVCVPHNEELVKILDCLEPVEQWNFLCRDHCQVPKKFSVNYSTFPVDSDSAIIQWYKNNSKKMYRV